ncbi:methyltransferase domain-containing protein [Deinococcus cellulosilyticus]|uniref:Methyltransferase domain-containing protein n=1 Tax=Deinococcus cellulosilyticus (strain DSM 18568 / NBRC 106333 / KACC 11606 / 5516J-15) TaxID=1223518 RepID=A0A511N2B7_DEIC1|nr:methyltransferase domain-containing protein [Deinococcus cellulosilyticus]GEM46995.1 hypothetical protein DC3_26300 [Deinococcus cellulosilyticus NBRC 106333 = KACC 11606]
MDTSTNTSFRNLPQGTGLYLSERNLQSDFPVLAHLFRPGQRVMDVGCGPGSITRGIAACVGPEGYVLGVDQDARLIEQAREHPHNPPQLCFEVQEATNLMGQDFDVVTASRLLLWVPDLNAVLESMLRVLKPGGLLVVLDNTARRITWTPELPESMQAYFSAYQAWRTAQGLNNQVADDLPDLLQELGCQDIQTLPSPEHTTRDHPLFEKRSGLWSPATSGRAMQVVQAGFFSEENRQQAEKDYRLWMQKAGQSITTHLATVVARKA